MHFRALVCALLLSASSARAEPASFPVQPPIRFLAIGDGGTGDKNQYQVARAIESVCKQRGCQFAIHSGDNIYERGVESIRDWQFDAKFEKPYQALAFPFFMVLGNHDQSGIIPGSGVHPERGDFEIAYTKNSDKWLMPARYYSFAAPVANANHYTPAVETAVIEFFVIDSNPLAPQNMPQVSWYRPGERFDREQRAWLKERLAASSAAWKVVVAHHPYRNNGRHRNAGSFEGLGLAKGEELKRMYEELVCGKADLLISGHDHSLQWLAAYPNCGPKPEFLISGASAKSNGPGQRSNVARWEEYWSLGFFWIEATVSTLRIVAYDLAADGQPRQRYEGTIEKPREQ
jgi:tartrate-resistant acid phosphatase type 5